MESCTSYGVSLFRRTNEFCLLQAETHPGHGTKGERLKLILILNFYPGCPLLTLLLSVLKFDVGSCER